MQVEGQCHWKCQQLSLELYDVLELEVSEPESYLENTLLAICNLHPAVLHDFLIQLTYASE